MNPPSSIDLPRLLVLSSTIISSVYLGLIIPNAIQQLWKISIILFTILFHSCLTRSHSPDPNTVTRSHFYINPLETPFNAWSFLISFSWITFFIKDFNRIWLGSTRESTHYCSAILSGAEATINAYCLYILVQAWRKKRSLSTSA
ncbi:hypothetical protein BDN70DRAFT_870578 [Pholiota conissans]|uniref:Uncharacterized protein n=1 Tax=Pholiota conissans TaxID=109636 RepID=A0A9P6D7X0_9AGAR|nr:hypothetical protein BDN70DRAFT_870578 [Pholiota conissans]